jgi:hypothetical protein
MYIIICGKSPSLLGKSTIFYVHFLYGVFIDYDHGKYMTTTMLYGTYNYSYWRLKLMVQNRIDVFKMLICDCILHVYISHYNIRHNRELRGS